MTKEKYVEIKGAKILFQNDSKKEDICLVPEKISYYIFPDFTNDIILDINEKKHIALTGHTGCIAGDTIININRGGKG